MMSSLFFLALLSAVVAFPAPGVVSNWAFRENATWKYSHCSSFVKLASGNILAVFQASQSTEGAYTQVRLLEPMAPFYRRSPDISPNLHPAHKKICPQEKFLVRSVDGGATWSAPGVLVANQSGNLLPWDGTMFIDAAGDVRYVFAGSDVLHQSNGPLFTMSSPDAGATWTAPTLVVPTSLWNRSMSNINPPVRLADGRLALPVNTVPGRPSESGPVTSGLIVVGGDGELWAPLGGVVPGPELGLISTYLEPAVAFCAPPFDSQMLMFLRTNIGQLWAARSTDAGVSWSAPFETPFRNPDSKVNLVKWAGAGAGGGAPADGDLVLVLNPDANWGASCNATHPYCARTPLSLTVSRDCGGSWGPLYDVEVDAGDHWSFGYPTAHQCATAEGAPALCITYSVNTNGTVPGGIRYSVVPAANLV